MKILISILIVSICLTGCATWTKIHRDSKGRIEKVESGGAVKTIIKEGGIHIEQDSKKEPFTLEIPITKVGK